MESEVQVLTKEVREMVTSVNGLATTLAVYIEKHDNVTKNIVRLESIQADHAKILAVHDRTLAIHNEVVVEVKTVRSKVIMYIIGAILGATLIASGIAKL